MVCKWSRTCLSINPGYVRDASSIPRMKIPGGGHGNPLQYSGLDNPMGRGTSKATDYGDAKSETRLKRLCRSSINYDSYKDPIPKCFVHL